MSQNLLSAAVVIGALRVKIITKSSELHEVLPHHTRQHLTDYTKSNMDQ